MRPIEDILNDLSSFIDLFVDIDCLNEDELSELEKIETELYAYAQQHKTTE